MSASSRLLVTSIIRHADLERASGFVRVLALSSGNILMKSPVPESIHRARDLNPRGGLRGARGATFCAGKLALANTERILLFDSAWKLCGEISHPLMGGIHDLLADPEGIWVACTSADLLIRVNWEGALLSVWEWRTDLGLREQLGFGHVARVNRHVDYRNPESSRNAPRNLVHLNSIGPGGDKILVCLGRVVPPHTYKRRVVAGWVGSISKRLGVRRASLRTPGLQPSGLPSNLEPGSSFVILELNKQLQANLVFSQAGNQVPNHNVALFEDTILFNDTERNELVNIDLSKGIERRLAVPGSPGFLRGMALIDSNVFIGSQAPATVYQVDLRRWQITRAYALGGSKGESVFGVTAIPGDFSPPPEKLDRLM